MHILDGFEHILMAAIRSSSHSDEKISDEQRFENAMFALFGDYYPGWYEKATSEFSHQEILHVIRLKELGSSFPKAIKAVKNLNSPENPAQKRDQEAEVGRLVEQLKKHIARRLDYYKSFEEIDSGWDLKPNGYEDDIGLEDRRRLREEAFAALRKCG